MKTLRTIITSVMIATCCFMPAARLTANADAEKGQIIVSEEVEYFADGSSVTITVYEDVSAAAMRSVYSKSGSKTYTARNSSGEVIWKFIVKGTFSVNAGVSATCTNASYSTSNLASGWSLKEATAKKSGNTAVGDATFNHKTLFVVTDTKSCHVVLSCDANGNLT